MAEYIDKHKAYLLLKDLEAAYIYPPVKEAYGTAARHIDQIKPADVQPVKRGEWGKRAYDRLQCSYCGKCEDVATDFCPNCGARMEQEG